MYWHRLYSLYHTCFSTYVTLTGDVGDVVFATVAVVLGRVGIVRLDVAEVAGEDALPQRGVQLGQVPVSVHLQQAAVARLTLRVARDVVVDVLVLV